MEIKIFFKKKLIYLFLGSDQEGDDDDDSEEDEEFKVSEGSEGKSIISNLKCQICKFQSYNFRSIDLSFASTETKYIKLKPKTQNNIVIFLIFHKK